MSDMLIDVEGNFKRRKIKQNINQEIIAEMIITHCAQYLVTNYGRILNLFVQYGLKVAKYGLCECIEK